MHPLASAFNRPWAMRRREFNAIRANVFSIAPEAVRPKADSSSGVDEYEIQGGVAIIEISGIIMQEDTWINRLIAEYFGGTITEVVDRQFQDAIDSDAIRSILFKVKSPGGDAWGLDALSEKIFKARGKKPIVAHAENLNCSAAYWISSAADSVYSTKDTLTGSIGAMSSWLNYDGMMEQMGIKEVVLVSECSPDKLPDENTPEGLALYQQEVNDMGWLFVDAVARNRGVSREDVTSKFGAGWVKMGKDAQKAGMIDGVMSFDKVLMSLQNGRMPTRNASFKGQNMGLIEDLLIKAGWKAPEGEPAAQAEPPAASAPTVAPEIQARLDKLAQLESQQSDAEAAAYNSRLEAFKATAAEKLPPAAIKSADNPEGIDLDATFAKFDQAGLGADFTALFASTAKHPLFEKRPTPTSEIPTNKPPQEDLKKLQDEAIQRANAQRNA